MQGPVEASTEPQSGWLSGRGFRVLVIVAIVAGIGFGYYFAASDGAAKIRSMFEKPVVSEMGPTMTLDAFIVNVAGTRGDRFLKATVTLELSNEKAVTAIQPLMAPMRDAVIEILSSQTLSDLEATAARQTLKTAIAARLNEVIGSPLVVGVYFQDFVMQ
jgi:flagellar FliL protein